MELKGKWSRLCQRVHSQSQWNQPTRPCKCNNATTSSNSNSNLGLCLSFEEAPTFHGMSKIKHQDVKTTLSLLPDSVEASEEVYRHESEGMEARPAAQEPDAAAAKPSDMKSVPLLSTCELLPSAGDLKRKAESVGVRMLSESKRWKGCGGGLDLNLRADEEEEDGGGGSSEDELVPSDLTNDGEASGEVTDSLDSHCQAAVTFDH